MEVGGVVALAVGSAVLTDAVRESLGSRVHPLSGVNCDYFLCDYLAGTVENRDTAENVDAIWIPWRDVTRFIPADRIFPPILRALGAPA